MTTRVMALALAAAVVTLTSCAPARPARAPGYDIDLITPLPPSFEVHLPAPDIPPAVAALAGIWQGEWTSAGTEGGAGLVSHTLVVTRILPAGQGHSASVIWSVGRWPDDWKVGEEGFWEAQAIIDADGTLRVTPPTTGAGMAVYRSAGKDALLAGDYTQGPRPLKGVFRRLPK